VKALAAVRAWFVWFWTNHVQKTFGSLLIGTGLYDEAADLYTDLVTYAPELGDMLGHTTYRRVRMACLAIMVARAVIRPKPTP
jgi:hypothetical protein